MKNLIIILAVLFTGAMNAQLKIAKAPESNEIGRVVVNGDFVIGSYTLDVTHVIFYQDSKYRRLNKLESFNMNGQAFQELYDLIISNIDSPPDQDIILDLKKGYVSVIFESGKVRFFSYGGFSHWLSKRDIDELFGKL